MCAIEFRREVKKARLLDPRCRFVDLTLFPDHKGAGEDRNCLSARLQPRFHVKAHLHVPDVAYLPLLLEERFAMSYPEDTAAVRYRSFAG
jgi:hypothetical protein